MTRSAAARRWTTHDVANQPPPLVDWDVAAYPALLEGLQREGAGWYEGELHRIGVLAGGAQAQQWAREADRNVPELVTHDRFGHRVDEVAYHPAYHQRMDIAIAAGLAGGPWTGGFAPANVVADLAVECEAMTATLLRLAGAFGRAHAGDARERMFARLAVPVLKYWVTRRAVTTVAEALECLGGNGYVEESVLPRIYREVPLQSLWEGSGNIQALDVLRAAVRTPKAIDVVFDEIDQASRGDTRLGRAAAALRTSVADREGLEYRARALAEQLACVLQASLLVRFAPAAVADAFCATRLPDVQHPPRHLGFGTLPRGCDTATIIARATPTFVQ